MAFGSSLVYILIWFDLSPFFIVSIINLTNLIYNLCVHILKKEIPALVVGEIVGQLEESRSRGEIPG